MFTFNPFLACSIFFAYCVMTVINPFRTENFQMIYKSFENFNGQKYLLSNRVRVLFFKNELNFLYNNQHKKSVCEKNSKKSITRHDESGGSLLLW